MNSNVKTHNSSFLAYSTVLLLACVFVAPNTFADDQIRRETIKFADLNLSTSAGAEALYRRINLAAQRVCDFEATSVYGQSILRKCVRPAVDAAVAKVNNPLLTGLAHRS